MGSPVHRVSMGDTWSRQVHPDIESERHMQSFNVEELTNILDGGAQNTALRRKVESIIHSDPELSLKDNYFMTQNERYEAAIKKKFHIQMLAQRLGWSEDSRELYYANSGTVSHPCPGPGPADLLRSPAGHACLYCAHPESRGPQPTARENMLSRFAQVLPDGTYIKLGTAKSNYLSMVVVRVDILSDEVIPLLQKACVIAIRYSVIRRQSRLRPRQGAPRGATAARATSIPQCLPPDTNPLPESTPWHQRAHCTLCFNLHALSAGMKALVSDFCMQGAELCRRACGGHGYSKLSGLPSLVTRVTASCTYEGENTVLYLQTARFLVKSYLQAQESTSQRSLPQSVAYLTAPHLARCPAQKVADFLHPELYTTAWAHVAARQPGNKCHPSLPHLFKKQNLFSLAFRLIKDSVHHLQTLMQSGADRHEAWNQTTVIHLQATKAHLYYVTVKIFTEALEKLENQPAIQQVLKRLCDLYALHGIMTNTGDFLHDGFLSGAQIDMARKAYLDLLLLIRKDAILLTDAFDFTDQCLNSALGCYDGNVYERLFQWAQKSPTNTQGNPAYEKYIRPLLQGWRSRL
eukprot:bmy_19372T0